MEMGTEVVATVCGSREGDLPGNAAGGKAENQDGKDKEKAKREGSLEKKESARLEDIDLVHNHHGRKPKSQRKKETNPGDEV